MRTIRYLIAALVMTTTLAIPTPAEAHGAYPHNVWRASTCVPGLSWAYVDHYDPQQTAHDWYHAHGWTGSGYDVRVSAGNMSAVHASYGWECSYLGWPIASKLQWHDAGRLVQRQMFGNKYGGRYQVQLVYANTSYYSSYTVQIWAT